MLENANTHRDERGAMAYSNGHGFGGSTKQKERSLVQIPTLKDLASLNAPEAIEDEWGVMSCILASPQPQVPFLKVAQVLEPKHFALPLLQDIWRIMLDMHSKHLPISFHVFQAYVEDFAEKNRTFFEEFLPRMYENTHDEEHVRLYAERIRNKYYRRTLIATCSEAIAATVSHMEPSDALVEIERKLSTVKQEIHYKVRGGGSSFRSLLADYVADIEEQAAGNKAPSTINTASWYDFNMAAQGFAPGDFFVIAAPTSCGKSMTGIAMAREFALEGHSVLYATLEMTKRTVLERIMSPVLGFSAGAMSRTGEFTDARLEEIRKFKRQYSDLPIAIKKPHQNAYDSFIKAAAEAEAEFREQQGDDWQGFRVVIVDYLQLLAANVPSQFRVQEIDRVSQLLRNYALENDCTVIALAQYDTETAKSAKEPDSLNCLSYCKTIDNHATQVIMMWHPYFGDRKKLHDATYIDFLWMKNRDGSNERVRMGIDWAKSWLFSLANDGKSHQPPKQEQKDHWGALAEKYGTPAKTKQLQPSETTEITVDLPSFADPLLAPAMPKGVDATLVIPEVGLEDELIDENDIIEVQLDSAVESPVLEAIETNVTSVAEESLVAIEAVTVASDEPNEALLPTPIPSDSIVICDVSYRPGEEVMFQSGVGSIRAKLIGIAENLKSVADVEVLESVPADALTKEYSGKDFLYAVGEQRKAHFDRISKLE